MVGKSEHMKTSGVEKQVKAKRRQEIMFLVHPFVLAAAASAVCLILSYLCLEKSHKITKEHMTEMNRVAEESLDRMNEAKKEMNTLIRENFEKTGETEFFELYE